MDTSPNVANAWQRLRRQSLFPPVMAAVALPAANADAYRGADAAPFDAAETLPMLYRSEAFAEDLFDSHPPV